MVEPLRHRQTKGAATDMFYLTPPRHISTLPRLCVFTRPGSIFRPRAESELGPLILQQRTRGECISLSASCCHWQKCGAIPSPDQYGRGFGIHRRRRRRRPVVQGRAISNGCTFAPPAIRGFDGSMCSRSSRFWTSARATTKASFRLLACRSATLKKASPK